MAAFTTGLFRHPRRALPLLVVLVGVAALLVGRPTQAHPPVQAHRPVEGYASYGVTLEDASGAPLRTFHHGAGLFVLGHLGERFNVRLRNHTDRRVEAVLTIDGRDAVSGGAGDYSRQRGYLIPPHGSVLVEGFRQNLAEVAAFRFSRPRDSYSARMGTPENVGVVGVAFFPERRAWRPRPAPLQEERRWRGHDEPRETSPSAPRAPGSRKGRSAGDSEGSASPSGEHHDFHDDGASRSERKAAAPRGLGTEYGESRWSRVTEVSFQRESATSPAAVLTVRYDDAEGLVARGIEVYPRRYRADWDDSDDDEGFWGLPAAFPRNRFAPPPPDGPGY